MIKSFKDSDTRKLADGQHVARFANIERAALRKIRQLQIAGSLNDLRVPPGNHLEALKGDREGQHSIRINDQYRICFVWTQAGCADVEIVDYH
ncbi:MAG TPA: type II toxin-antitoxin system RelE/ParE family toxin [Coriobacteriaceae bacterium]|nr:type II toxin-antitoxin system RelE/ParE family toxin [Coriobacteriaceae bacterium]